MPTYEIVYADELGSLKINVQARINELPDSEVSFVGGPVRTAGV